MTFADKYRLMMARKAPAKTQAAPDKPSRAAFLRLYAAIRAKTSRFP